MVKKSALKMALVSEKGTDFKKQHQKKMAKKARKEQKTKKPQEDWEDVDSDAGGDAEMGEAEDDDESEDEAPRKIDFAGIDDSDSDSEDEDEEGLAELAELEAAELAEAGSDEEDIPVSDLEDLEDEDKEDMIPHQRLTINNTTALTAALKRIALPTSKMPFSEYQSITTSEPVVIADVSDDLNRELAFYAQSLSAVKEARTKLKTEGAPWSRPTDYFAEMVKADEHMAKIKAKLIDEAAGKKASAEARKQRDLKKFGKQVQVAKLQERDKERKQTMEKIKVMKRKRQDGDAPTEAGEADLFDVALEDATKDTKGRDRRDAKGGNKRQKRDEKYGYGGKKRFSKSGDAQSSGDLKGFSSKKMKKGPQRPGKARRAGGKR